MAVRALCKWNHTFGLSLGLAAFTQHSLNIHPQIFSLLEETDITVLFVDLWTVSRFCYNERDNCCEHLCSYFLVHTRTHWVCNCMRFLELP